MRLVSKVRPTSCSSPTPSTTARGCAEGLVGRCRRRCRDRLSRRQIRASRPWCSMSSGSGTARRAVGHMEPDANHRMVCEPDRAGYSRTTSPAVRPKKALSLSQTLLRPVHDTTRRASGSTPATELRALPAQRLGNGACSTCCAHGHRRAEPACCAPGGCRVAGRARAVIWYATRLPTSQAVPALAGGGAHITIEIDAPDREPPRQMNLVVRHPLRASRGT